MTCKAFCLGIAIAGGAYLLGRGICWIIKSLGTTQKTQNAVRNQFNSPNNEQQDNSLNTETKNYNNNSISGEQNSNKGISTEDKNEAQKDNIPKTGINSNEKKESKVPHWTRIVANSKGHFVSHTREVMKSTIVPSSCETAFPAGCVVKAGSESERRKKMEGCAYSEEISYKICKLLKWNVIPKTKVIHGTKFFEEEVVQPKHQKYFDLFNSFWDGIKQGYYTYTFTAFVEGNTPVEDGFKTEKDGFQDSYQKTFLLDMLLGKQDAHAGNIIQNSSTGELFEIDNEYIGRSYDSKGALRNLPSEMDKEINQDLLNVISSLKISDLLKIKTKYCEKALSLEETWNRSNERIIWMNINLWLGVITNLYSMQKAIKNSDSKLTIKQLEAKVKKEREEFEKQLPPISDDRNNPEKVLESLNERWNKALIEAEGDRAYY